MVRSIPKINNPTQLPIPCRFTSIAKLIDPIERESKIKPTYNDKVSIESAGLVTNIKPTIRVSSPKTKDQPQFSIDLRLLSAKTTSKIPLIINETLMIIASVSKELNGVLNTTKLVKMNNIPTISGIYQCLIAFFKEDQK